MHFTEESDTLPVRDLGRKLRNLSVTIVGEPPTEDMAAILEKLKRKLDDERAQTRDFKSRP